MPCYTAALNDGRGTQAERPRKLGRGVAQGSVCGTALGRAIGGPVAKHERALGGGRGGGGACVGPAPPRTSGGGRSRLFRDRHAPQLGYWGNAPTTLG